MVSKVLWDLSFPRCTAGPNIVGSCCIPFHTTANTDVTTPNIVGPTMLEVVTPVCTWLWPCFKFTLDVTCAGGRDLAEWAWFSQQGRKRRKKKYKVDAIISLKDTLATPSIWENERKNRGGFLRMHELKHQNGRLRSVRLMISVLVLFGLIVTRKRFG